jgi:hypothetical protein
MYFASTSESWPIFVSYLARFDRATAAGHEVLTAHARSIGQQPEPEPLQQHLISVKLPTSRSVRTLDRIARGLIRGVEPELLSAVSERPVDGPRVLVAGRFRDTIARPSQARWPL